MHICTCYIHAWKQTLHTTALMTNYYESYRHFGVYHTVDPWPRGQVFHYS